MKPNHERPAQLLAAIRKHWTQVGYAPSIRWLSAETGIKSTSQIRKHLLTLKDAGVVDWEFNKSRTLHIVEGKE